jgi:hypothetical protein
MVPLLWRATGAAVLLIALGGCSKGPATTISLDQPTIQAKLAKAFPLSSDKAGDKNPIRITLTDPQVVLEEGSDRLGLRMKVVVEPPAKKPPLPEPPFGKPGDKLPRPESVAANDVLEGTLSVRGAISYKPEEAAFYYQNLTIEKLQFPQLPASLEAPVRDLAEGLLAGHLQRHPIYTLTDTDLKSRAARSVLKSVAVKNGKLDIEIGW